MQVLAKKIASVDSIIFFIIDKRFKNIHSHKWLLAVDVNGQLLELIKAKLVSQRLMTLYRDKLNLYISQV
jgi:6-pyruvoyl-tetrahydropterin synthase